MKAETNEELTLRHFFWGMNLPPTFSERKRLIKQMAKGETSWRKKMLKCPSGEKKSLCQNKVLRMHICPYSVTSMSCLSAYKSE